MVGFWHKCIAAVVPLAQNEPFVLTERSVSVNEEHCDSIFS